MCCVIIINSQTRRSLEIELSVQVLRRDRLELSLDNQGYLNEVIALGNSYLKSKEKQ